MSATAEELKPTAPLASSLPHYLLNYPQFSAWQAQQLTCYIDQNLGRGLRCVDIARAANLSISHCSRVFRASFGCPPHTYLTQRRIERAQQLMLSTSLTLGQIACDCGFADQAHFSRVFRRLAQASPLQWRRARLAH